MKLLKVSLMKLRKSIGVEKYLQAGSLSLKYIKSCIRDSSIPSHSVKTSNINFLISPEDRASLFNLDAKTDETHERKLS